MRQRLREWLAETHRPRFELLRHFLPRFFDSDLVASSSDWTRVASGAFAILGSGWILLTAVLFFKYKQVPADRLPMESAADLATIAGMAVCLTILLVVVLWQSVYPTLRDCLALAALPVSAADIFLAKFSALVTAFLAFALLVTVPSSLVLAGTAGVALTMSLLVLTAICAAVFFGLIALQGALLHVLPTRAFERAMIWLQALLAAVALGGFPLAAWKAPDVVKVLPLNLSHLWWTALLAPPAAAILYMLGFHRYRRLLLEASRVSAPRNFDILSRLLDLFVRDPREQAAFGFFIKTIRRSRTHRLAVLVYCGLAAAWMAKSAVDLMALPLEARQVDRVFLTTGPLALILITLFGLRHLFSLPAELRANWMFQITEREGRLAWLNAVERFVLGCGVAPVVVIGTIVVARVGGPVTAAAWAVIAFLLSAIVFERLFRDWRKLPFTCSYLPGKRPLILNMMVYLVASPLLLPIAWILYGCATNPASFLVLAGLELACWQWMRRSRMAQWGMVPLRYEEQLESEVNAIDLTTEGTTIAQEQFQREWSDYMRRGPDVPILSPLDAGETWSVRILEWLRAAPQDLRYGLRAIWRSPGFALTVVGTLGLGLGLNAAFFSIFNAFLLRPLAVRDPSSLYAVDLKTRSRTDVHLSWTDYQAVFARTPAFVDTAATTVEVIGLDGRSAKVDLVSGNYFTMMGAGIALGRPFVDDEQDAVVVLSYRIWQGRFGADAKILGRKVLVGGMPFEVIGVAAPEFAGDPVGGVAIAHRWVLRYGVGAPDFWVPIEVWNRTPGLPENPVRGVIARLRPDTTEARARAIVTAMARRVTADREDYRRVSMAEMESLDIPITWTALTHSMPLLIAFGLTMLIPCANAANMMLARALVRQRELGTRLSLGASRGRIVRQLLTEAMVLALMAGVAGLALARVALDLFADLIYKTAPPTLLYKVRIPDFTLDPLVFLYIGVVAALATVLFALAPAAQATRAAVSSTIRGEFGAIRASRFRDALVVGQVAACVMLLVTAAVLLRGTRRIIGIERGYEARGVFAAINQSPENSLALLSILAQQPWVETVAVGSRPLNEMYSMRVGNPSRPGWQDVYYHGSSGEFFHLVRIPMIRGRVFTRAESESRAPVAVVSEGTARRLWPGENPIGKTLAIEPGSATGFRRPRFREATVIGVSRDIVSRARDGGPRPSVHFPDTLWPGAIVMVRGKGSADSTARNLEAALARAPGSAAGARIAELQETLDWETYPQQAVAWLSTLLGGVALLLTITGMYGVLSFLVSQRTKEIGIRMALGATRAQVARFILTYSARLAGAGLAIGAVLGLGVLQYTASKIVLLIDLLDVPAYALSLGVVAVSALLATLAPARRACGVDPQEALRAD